MHIIFLGTLAQGLQGNGKQVDFIDVATPILVAFGHTVQCLSDARELAHADRERPTLICMIYNEEGRIDETVEPVEAYAKRCFADLRVLHPYGLGTLVGNKLTTLRLMENHGVPSPPLIQAPRADRAVLSRDPFGSGLPVDVVRAGCEIDPRKVSTAFVDTTFRHKGADYYVCLRSMCFWDRHVSTYVRCRPASDGDVSVHAADTPADIELLNHAYSLLVTPRLVDIIEICRRAGEALGPGFYSHDLLPSTKDGPILLCETGFKYDEISLRLRLRHLRGRLLMSDLFDGMESVRMAYAFVQAIDRIPRWNETSKSF